MNFSFERSGKRQYYKEKLNIELYQVLLDEDREQSAFASSVFYQSLQTLSIEEQKKVQLGTQWINSFETIHPVLTGRFAKAFHAKELMDLYLPIEFSIRHKYAELAHLAQKGFGAIVSKNSFEIKEFGLRVRHEPDSPALLTALYPLFFGARVLIENIDLERINFF
ncbi:MAG TPA: hypothetical protein VFO76_04455 [Candidatus Kapabacteria bacterium]|nr:hypothetical protein [Candidatus Kapabacteria bacterium]